MSPRQKVLRIVEVYKDVRDLGISVAQEDGVDALAARERIRMYLVAHTEQVVGGMELEVVSGISEYGRRIRELRVEHGYQIASGASPDPEAGINLRPDEYVLVAAEPDQDAARRWQLANRIRRSEVGSKGRVLQYLRANVGRVVTTEELAYVAKDAKEFARRARELRSEEGYAIATRFTGRPDLRSGQYILESEDRIAPAHDRHIPDPVQRQVYERDRNTCRVCGWNRDRWTRADPRFLELHHVLHHADRGPNTPENLIVICSRCHDEIHAGRLQLPPDVCGPR